MTEYIERIALRNTLYEADAITMEGVKILNQFPAADVAEVRHGRWDSFGGDLFKCSECMAEIELPTTPEKTLGLLRYCYNCGARMNGGNEND